MVVCKHCARQLRICGCKANYGQGKSPVETVGLAKEKQRGKFRAVSKRLDREKRSEWLCMVMERELVSSSLTLKNKLAGDCFLVS